MSSRGRQNPRPYTASPPGSRRSQNRTSRGGQNPRPYTAPTPGSRRTQEGEFEQKCTELEIYCTKQTEKHAQEKLQLLNTIQSIKEEKEKFLRSELEEKKKEWKIHVNELRAQHVQEKDQLRNTIERLTVEKETLLKRDLVLNTIEVEQVLNKMKEKHEKETAQLLKCIDSLNKEKEHILTREREQLENIIHLNVEKKKLLKRLSIITSDRLTHENPNIADLSDEDRPTKLQEVYGELYNNEWTDAFEELIMHNNVLEKDAIGILLKIIMNRSEEEVKLVNAYNDEKTNEKTKDNNALEGAANEETACEQNTSEHKTMKTAEANMNTTSAEKNGAENNKSSGDSKNGEEKHKASADPKSIAEDNMKEDNANIDTGSNGKEEAAKEDEEKKETYDVQTEKMWSTNTSKDMSTNKKLDAGTEQKDKERENKETHEDPKQAKYSIELNVDILHALKRTWKMASSELKGISVESIYSVVVTNLDMPLESMPKTSKYLKSCVDLCWKMGVQEMPLHLESIDDIDVKAEKKFDKEKFRHYTKSGENVDFVVWPALYLYEGGPLLLKGIAQGC